jgi:hypothetical protein
MKIWSINREIRFLETRKMFPDRYQNSEPMTEEIIDQMIKELKQKRENLRG